MASFIYTKCIIDVMTSSSGPPVHVDFDLDTIKCMLMRSTYSEVKTSDVVNDIATEECGYSGFPLDGYTSGYGGAGRKALTTNSVTEQVISTYTAAVFDSTTDPNWNPLGGTNNNTMDGAVIFKELTSDAASALICWLDFSPDITTNGGSFTIQFATPATGGICYIGC